MAIALDTDWDSSVIPLVEERGVYNFYLKKADGQNSWAVASLSSSNDPNQDLRRLRADIDKLLQKQTSGSGFARQPKV